MMMLKPNHSKSVQPPAMSAAPAPAVLPQPGGWTAELILSLDWLRLNELLRAVATHAGCVLGESRFDADGSVQFAMVEQPHTAQQRYSLVRMAAWNEWAAKPMTMAMFAKQLRRMPERARGIFVAPAGFSNAALTMAMQHHIETISAAKLAQTLNALPAERSAFYLSLTVTGAYHTPSCPCCKKKLIQKAKAPIAPLQEWVCKSSAILSDALHCERLIIESGAEVTFLEDVHVKELVIRGYASGHFICDGDMKMEAGSRLEGKLLARSGSIHAKAELLAEAEIIEDDEQPLSPFIASWSWQCASGHAACQKIQFEPHQ
jgi:hypothetical protein